MKLLRDQMEKERRDARIAAAARRAETREVTPQEPPPREDGDEDDEDEVMPGAGNVLGGPVVATYKSPPSNKKTD